MSLELPSRPFSSSWSGQSPSFQDLAVTKLSPEEEMWMAVKRALKTVNKEARVYVVNKLLMRERRYSVFHIAI